MTSEKTAVVVSGHTMALAVVRALGAAGVPVVVAHYDERDIAHRSRYATAELRTPNPEHDDALFVKALLEAEARFGGSVLIPASDESLVALSRHKRELSRYYIVGCSDWDVTEGFIDKARTYALAEACGVRAPQTIVPASAADLAAGAERIGFPLLVKPAKSHLFYTRFKRKMVRVADPDELRDAYKAATEAGLQVMLQEIIPGDDSHVVNYNCYRCDGRSLVEFTARQIRKAPPEFGSPRVVRSERIPEVLEPGREILRALGFEGFACVEFKRDARDGRYTLMEVNGRHNLSGLLAVRCGINFPLLHYRHLAEGEVPAAADFVPGIYWVDMFRDIGYSLGYVAAERYRPGRYLAPYVRPHCDAILDRKDLGPFRARFSYLLRHASRTAGAAGAGRSPLRVREEAQ
jgi:predicted ATP-grasp superfamily ATP-dependent carboligase